MVDNLSLPNIPTSKMFIDDPEDKILTTQWQEFFRGLYNRVGGLTAPTMPEIVNTTIAEAYKTEGENYGKRLDDLEKLMQALVSKISPKKYDSEIDALEDLLHAFPDVKSYDKRINELEKALADVLVPEPLIDKNEVIVVLDTPKSYDNDTTLKLLAETQPSKSKILGPQSSTDNAIARWNGTNGHALQDSDPTIDDDGKITVPSLTASQLVKTDASKVLTSTIGTAQVPICMDMFDAVPERASESNWHGGLLLLAIGDPLDTDPTDINVTKGHGKIIVVVNAGGDLVGDITLTGDTVDRNTGVITPGDTDTITVDALTTDNTTTDANGNIIHAFVGAYITSKWFTGAVVLSTVNLTLTDVDVYHCSFEQSNDSPNLVINTFDANIFTTNVNAEFDAYLYTVHVTGDKCNVDNEAELHVGAVGETAIANKYWRLRQGNIDEDLDGLTDGFFVDVFYDNSPVYIEDVTVSVWLTKTVTVELS